MAKKIFITGCAKSGTTLLLRMCYAFKDTEVLYREGSNGHELPFEQFVSYESDKRFVIGKRHPPALLSNVLTRTLEQQYKTVKEKSIAIINVVRDGRDVVLSDGNYVRPIRWIESIRQRELYSDVIVLEVKYEDLIRNPQKVQSEMESKLGLESQNKFSEYPDYVEDWVFEWNVSVLARRGQGNRNNYGKRKLSEVSIGKDLDAYRNICSNAEIDDFEDCLRELGYVN